MMIQLTQQLIVFQITFDFTNCPNAKGRYYDYKAIADVIDFAFVMDYDEYYGTYGGANAPYDVTKRGAFL